MPSYEKAGYFKNKKIQDHCQTDNNAVLKTFSNDISTGQTSLLQVYSFAVVF